MQTRQKNSVKAQIPQRNFFPFFVCANTVMKNFLEKKSFQTAKEEVNGNLDSRDYIQRKLELQTSRNVLYGFVTTMSQSLIYDSFRYYSNKL